MQLFHSIPPARLTRLFVIIGMAYWLPANALQAQAPDQTSEQASDQTATTSGYQVRVDLTTAENDQLRVTLTTPAVSTPTVRYVVPKIVPGTYRISDFGRFTTQLTAHNATGTPLPVTRIDDNTWEIAQATSLAEVRYTLDDTFDSSDEPIIFEPAGTNIEAGNFILNPFGIVGYLVGYKNLPYTLEVTRDSTFYGSTALPREASTATVDTFGAINYDQLADSPIMYCVPDTASVQIGQTEVIVSVYSPLAAASEGREGLTAAFVLREIESVMQAARNYMGGTLPVDRYAYIIYLTDLDQARPGSGFGALEHSYSSLYFLPDIKEGRYLVETIRHVAAHEFFHIITPLNVHAEEIGDFDFLDPKMSRHLWLYEGVTEYFAGHAQAYEGLLDYDEYLSVLNEKITNSRTAFNDSLPFVELSTGCLDTYEDQYLNVYEKGALIGLCLDITLRAASNNEESLIQLLGTLSERFGPQRSFQDSVLFDLIDELTQAPLREWFATYVEGPTPLPIEEALEKVGVRFTSGGLVEGFAAGNLIFDERFSTYLETDLSGIAAKGYYIPEQSSVKDQTFSAQSEIITHIDDIVLTSNQSEIIRLLKAKEGKKVRFRSIFYDTETEGFRERTGKVRLSTVSARLEPSLSFIPIQELSVEQIQLRSDWLNIPE